MRLNGSATKIEASGWNEEQLLLLLFLTSSHFIYEWNATYYYADSDEKS